MQDNKIRPLWRAKLIHGGYIEGLIEDFSLKEHSHEIVKGLQASSPWFNNGNIANGYEYVSDFEEDRVLLETQISAERIYARDYVERWWFYYNLKWEKN